MDNDNSPESRQSWFRNEALPLSVPRRAFGLFSWITTLKCQELMSDGTKHGVSKLEELEELEKNLGEKSVQFSI